MPRDRIQGVGLSPGMGTGRLHFLVVGGWPAVRDEGREGQGLDNEQRRFERHADSLADDLWHSVAQLEAESLSAEAEIVRAHLSMLKDPEFRSRVHATMEEAELAAEAAVEAVTEEFARLLEESGDVVFAERAADLRDLAAQLRAKLRGEPYTDLTEATGRGAVIAVPEMLPSLVIRAWNVGVRGVVVEKGTSLSHSAILAKSLALPVVRVASLDALREHEGAPVAVDADAGLLTVEPEVAKAGVQAAESGSQAAREGGPAPARLWLNVVLPDELVAVDWQGVEGVGLFRTEPLFLQKQDDFPGEEEQREAYERLFALCGNRPVTVRTLDAGGDKPLAYMSVGREGNPQLGLRAHRLYRFHPELLITQARAVLRAGLLHAGPLRLMYPFVCTLDEWVSLQDLVEEAMESLRADGTAFREEFARGLMVETPSAAWCFKELMRHADFAGIGTNDLVQYMLAVDRSNANVAALYRPEEPVILRVLKDLVETAGAASKSLTLCGEMASDHYLLPLLLGLGIRDFSVSVPSLPLVRRSLSALRADECEGLAEQCLCATTGAEVREVLAEWHEQACPWERHVVATATDPVCKMAVDPDSSPYTIEHDGKRYFFCRRRCMEAFQRQIAGR